MKPTTINETIKKQKLLIIQKIQNKTIKTEIDLEKNKKNYKHNTRRISRLRTESENIKK